LLHRGFDGPWCPHPDPDECKGNPCNSHLIIDLIKSVKNHHASEGMVQNHARAIWISDITAMQNVMAAHCPLDLVLKALNPKIPNDSFTLKQQDDLHSHLMLCALTSLGWTLWTRYLDLVLSAHWLLPTTLNF
jgi:hypothetical protein